MFPGCEEEGPPNAGLFTYRVPQESIKIGDVFDQVQARKDEVDLVDYSIAQPSLEAFNGVSLNSEQSGARAEREEQRRGPEVGGDGHPVRVEVDARPE